MKEDDIETLRRAGVDVDKVNMLTVLGLGSDLCISLGKIGCMFVLFFPCIMLFFSKLGCGR